MNNAPQHANSRRALFTGATAAGLSAILAARAPQAAAAASDPVKLVCALRRREDLSAAEFYRYWLYDHGPHATKQIKKLGGYRYVQSHTNNSDLNLLFTASRGQVGRAFDGVTEVWFPSREALVKALASPQGAEANLRLAEDERNFIDLPRSSYFFTKEHVLLG
ncbi:EthD domain-containing protein [Streptomyces sp. SP18BB07]|uniref:EthD domain-containing protein n=1 Tax=Streptomyces sp. SP18BB07 TaxID=3002522 RepID=UPI002E774C2B|nr:EthD domain-containing protein [Streptomyces sp. SP18BB07]MEE1765185.1 EthD domain-containing protein [Streptomyces sp. SP18BB07]